MKIQYSVPGRERKNLTAAIAQELEITVKYLGPPSFAYEVGGYRIDKDGVLSGNDNRSLVADLQGLHGFVPVSEKYDEASEVELWAEREIRRMKLGSEHIPDYSNRGPYGGDNIPDDCPEYYTYKAELSDPDYPDRFELFTAANDLEAYHFAMDFCTGEVTLLELQLLNEEYEPVRWVDLQKLVADNELYDTLEIEVPKNGITDMQVHNLMKLVESKRSLLAKALGRPLVIKDTGESLLFEFPYDNDTEAGNIYAQFATVLIRFVIKQQRINATEHESLNDKFSLRTFLVRLGMNGREYAAARKYLLCNLSGSSAYAKAEG